MEIDEIEKQSLLKVIKAEELSLAEEEFSSKKEEDLLNTILEESSEEPSSFENESDNEDAISYSGSIDSGANQNVIQEGTIPSKYFEITRESLKRAGNNSLKSTTSYPRYMFVKTKCA
ncbi:hypothetical protein E5676_scaffold5891G00060 [Cucumis melo var. makuwa]|uniref:Uncharacterized protein n=1 Tax=Cucumis melo var. makuwa TaxID=1194695 RepID=A0A5A7SZ34_CUCMM|nr:hypothetical protein E6C27_scaffold56G00470 [Cucumis melo var. makuwa]TYJ98815.1 hypothetical protein E5676_scaffold5891G00060 [Cucumis melo var. makuwa]